MNMGSATSEKNAENNDHTVEGQIQRPEFYPCNDCGRNFTKRALEIHKLSCSEDENCQCVVCKLTKVKRLKTEEGFLLGDSGSTIMAKDSAFCEHLHDILKNSCNQNNPTVSGTKLESVMLNGVDANPVLNSNNQHLFLKLASLKSEELLTEVPDGKNVNVPKGKGSPGVPESLESHHVGICSRKLFCIVCKQHIFWESFGTHALQHSIKAENNRLLCPQCSNSRSSATYYLMHFYTHIMTHDCPECLCEDPKCLDTPPVPLAEHCYAGNIFHRCYICLKFFSHWQTLINHMRLHSKEMPFSCPECNRSFRQIGNLQRHMTTHRGDRPHKCPNCSRSFADPATLRNHVRVHTRETPFVCKICSRGFSQVGNLKRHMALHVEKETNAASVKILSDENSEKHVGVLEDKAVPDESQTPPESEPRGDGDGTDSNKGGTVNGVSGQKKCRGKNDKLKLHMCKQCGKKYTWRHDLNIHYRVHTGERPYNCDLCDKRFAQSGAVRIHKLRHHSNLSPTKRRSRTKKIFCE